MANGEKISKSGMKIALFKHHILNTNPIYYSNNKHNNRVKEKKKSIKYMRTRIGHVAW